MKIDRLFTLSQFWKLLKSMDVTSEFRDVKYTKYLDFIEQELKKEMFICEVEMPIFPNKVELTEFEQKLLDKYEEAQKKVIFDGWWKQSYKEAIDYSDNRLYYTSIGMLYFDKEDHKILFINIKNMRTILHSVHDLAEATNGELKLKNIEL